MADVAKAYQFLNDSLNLNLDQSTMNRIEAGFKKAWLREKGFSSDLVAASEDEIMDNWEFFSYLAPRQKQPQTENEDYK